MRFIIYIFFYLLGSQFVYSKSANAILSYADSLVYKGQFAEAIEYLLPLESLFEEETDLNRYHYYGLIGAWYIRQRDYHSAVPYLEKKAKYNHTSIEDNLLLANLFFENPDFINENKAQYYSRKGLLMDDEINRFSFSKSHSNIEIGRMHYILGTLVARCGNRILAEDHLQWLSKNDCPIDIGLYNQLSKLIDTIRIGQNIEDNNSIRLVSYNRIKEALINKEVTSSVQRFGDYDVMSEKELDSITRCPNIDIIRYLRNVFAIEDKYDINEIDRSVSLLQRACELVNSYEYFKINSLELCELYMRLGRADYFLKQYDSAIKWFLLSYASSRKLKAGTLYNMQALGEISDIYLEKGEKQNSLLYADEMLENIVKIASEENINSEMLLYLGRYANVLFNTGYIKQAENFYRLIVEFAPKKSKAYSLACNNYATYLFLNNRRDEACYYYLLNKEASLTPQTTSNLSIAYLTLNKIIEAEKSFQEYYESNLSLFENVLKSFPEREWDDYWEKNCYEFYICCNYLASNIGTEASLITGYNAAVLSKVLPLTYKKTMNLILSSSENPQIKKDYNNYKELQHLLSSSQLPLSSKRQLINDVYAVERSLLQQCSFNNKMRKLINDYNKVVASLKSDEIAIEFCQYLDILNPKGYKYAAYIISPEYKNPLFIVIGDEVEISNCIFNLQKDELTINQLYNQPEICDLIWGKIMPYLKNKHTVYFSPVGELSVINHNVLQTKESRLGDMFDLRRVSSTSLLTNDLYKASDFTNIVLFGGINYDTSYDEIERAMNQNNLTTNRISPMRGEEDRREGWAQLQYTKQEIDSIQTICQKHNCQKTLYFGSNAIEEVFKALNYNAPSIIHVATHGFIYNKDEEEEKRTKIKSLSPYTTESIIMSWTGLLFSGANTHLKDQNLQNDFDDGILTASEISQLHLDGTKLVVLSACNTGLGFSDTFGLTTGLQKAFKLAGVESIVMSLWQVPDESTSLLMKEFYEALFDGFNRHDALKIARKKVREIYPDPYYWGAFVILD